MEEGLPHSRVVALHEDLFGYLWIGTYGGGIARFDGRKFESFDESNGLANSVVLGLQSDSKGNIWICTPLGISKFNRGSFKNFKGDLARGFFGFDIFEHRDTIYTILSRGDLRFGVILQDSIIGRNFNFGLQHSIVNVFAPDNNVLYINLSNGDLLRKDSKIHKIASNIKVYQFFKSNSGVHVLTPDGVFDIRNDSIVPRFEGFVADRIIMSSDSKYAWVRRGKNISKCYFTDHTWREESANLSFEPSIVFIDREGNDWFGTIGKGIFRLSPQNFKQIGGAKPFSSAYSFTADLDSNLWIGFKNGVSVYSPKREFIRSIDFKDENRNRISSLALAQDGSIWVASLKGLTQVSKQGNEIKWLTKTQGLNGDSIRTIELDDQGRLWIAYLNGGGLSIHEGTKNIRVLPRDGLYEGLVWDLKYSHKHKTMFVCTDMGVQKVANGIFKSIDIPEFKDKILLSLGIYKEDYLLIGSGGSGLAIFSILDGTYSILTTKDGLASNFIYLADSDKQDSIWVGTVKGIDLVTLDKLQKPNTLVHFSIQSGLGPNGVNTNASFFYGGKRFFGFVDGAYEFVPSKQQNKTSFPLHFVSIRTNVPVDILADTVFTSNQNAFEFIFNRVEKKGHPIRYQYILKNWDHDWINSSENNKVNYSNLSPGEYSFIVKSINLDSLKTDEISFSFTILYPFYQRFWFKIAVLVLLVLLVFLFIYVRTKIKVNQIILTERAKNEEAIRLREEIGRDFHDEVGNQLARIINYMGLLKMPTYPEKNLVLDKAVETSKYLLTGTKDFLWSIDPIHDNLDSLCVHIRDFGEKLLGEKGIEFRFFSNRSTNPSLPFGYTRQINLIFKEALTNAFKHSRATKVNLSLDQDEDKVTISLEDNGIGLGVDAGSKGDGLKNMLSRAAKVNALLFILPNTAKGITVKLEFTLKQKI